MSMLSDLKNDFRLLAEDRETGWVTGICKPLVSVTSGFYGIGAGLLRELRRSGIFPSKKLPFPVISVGNLTWGGTGKTPLVEYLAQRIIEKGKTPLILTRGYGEDEMEQFKAHLPMARIGVGKDRYRTAIAASAQRKVDIAILDDGFQHSVLTRDLEIVTVNALNPFGNGRLFPRGILRESPETLRYADRVVLTHADLVPPKTLDELRKKISSLAPRAARIEAALEPLFFYRASKRSRVPLQQLTGRRITTFSGLGCPRSFQLSLARLGMRPMRNFEFCDHHPFTEQELLEIREVSHKSEAQEIITTEKDFFRNPKLITQVLDPLVLVARMQVTSGEEALTDKIFSLLGVPAANVPASV